LRTPPFPLIRRAVACLSLSAALASPASAQSDPLISKTISAIVADEAGFWAFAADGLQYSRIDPFPSVLDIRNGKLPYRGGIRGGLGRSSSMLAFYDYPQNDTVTVGGITALDRNGKSYQDTLAFYRPTGKNSAVTAGVEFSALAMWHDTLIVGAGNGGFAVATLKAEGQAALAADSLIFLALPEDRDTAVATIRCALNSKARCPVADIATLAEKVGTPDSVAVLAVDSDEEGAWLLIGSQTGLRRGLLSGNVFPKVALPAKKPDGPIRIENIHVDTGRNLLWVFSGSEYFFSGDHGRTFHKVPPVPGGTGASAPDSLTGFKTAPQAVNVDDTTLVNFNLDGHPGLVLFKRDSVSLNNGTGDFADLVMDNSDGLPIQSGQGGLTQLAVVSKGAETVVVAGTTSKGLLLRKTGGSNSGNWIEVNSLKQLKGGLQEIITYPTLFSGTAPDGGPEYVNLGYRLKKDGNVTITVYNYAMEKVKTIVKGAHRKGGGNRSEVAETDRWDGKDSSGRYVSVGTYYILVESDKGEKGWGKAIAVHGRGQ
jgi:hypothetical protein